MRWLGLQLTSVPSGLTLESIHPADINSPQGFRELATFLTQAVRSPQLDSSPRPESAAGAQIHVRRARSATVSVAKAATVCTRTWRVTFRCLRR